MKIVRTRRYVKDLERIGASPADIAALEQAVASDPTRGEVIRGLGGIRKLRFALAGRGKSGGGRAIYFLILTDHTVLMLTAFAKNEKPDLSPADRKVLLALVKELTDGR